MPFPLPGMAPYLEQPTYCSAFHSRLIIVLADAPLKPPSTPTTTSKSKTHTYLSNADNESILVGIPDAIVLTFNSQAVE